MMRKYVLLLSTFSLVAFAAMAQKTSQINKAPGDTLYYQDFDSTGNFANNGVPLGWTIANNTTTGPAWEWADSSGTILTSPIVSPSDSNGFLRLVFPPPPIVSPAVDSYVSSGPISISPKSVVYVSWHQSMTYCCTASASASLVLELSTDNINWTAFNATNNRGPNTASPNGEIITLDVSNVFGNQSTVYIRFRWTGSTQYYWMIDDLLILEGPLSVGLSEEVSSSLIDIYPNPTNGLLNLDLGENRFQQLEIRNTLGALVYEQQILNPQMQLDLSHLEKGLYFVSFLGDNSREVKKIIIQ